MSKLTEKLFTAFDALNFVVDEVTSLKGELEDLIEDTDENEKPDLHETLTYAIADLEGMVNDMPDPYSMEFSDYPVEVSLSMGAYLTTTERYNNVLLVLGAVREVADNVIDSTQSIKEAIENVEGYSNVIFPDE